MNARHAPLRSQAMAMAVATAVIAMVTLFVVTARPAAACSCASSPVADRVGDADVAFTGRATAVTPPSPTFEVTYTFDVVQLVKGTAASPFPIMTSASGASCGASFVIGDLVGLVAVRQTDGTYTTNLCISPIDPAELTDPSLMAPPLVATGAGSPVVWAAGRDGPVGAIGADATPALSAFDEEPGQIGDLAVCPGGDRVVMITRDDAITYDARTLVEVARTALVLPPDAPLWWSGADALRCLSADGLVAAWIPTSTLDDGSAFVARIDNGVATLVPLGPLSAFFADVDPTGTHVATGPAGAVDLNRVRLLRASDGGLVGTFDTPGEFLVRLAFDPSGTRLAVITTDDVGGGGPPPASHLRIFGVGSAGFTPLSGPSPWNAASFPSDLRWLPDDRLLVATTGAGGVSVTDLSGTVLWASGVPATSAVATTAGVFVLSGGVLARLGIDRSVTPLAAVSGLQALDAVLAPVALPPPVVPVVEPSFTG